MRGAGQAKVWVYGASDVANGSSPPWTLVLASHARLVTGGHASEISGTARRPTMGSWLPMDAVRRGLVRQQVGAGQGPHCQPSKKPAGFTLHSSSLMLALDGSDIVSRACGGQR